MALYGTYERTVLLEETERGQELPSHLQNVVSVFESAVASGGAGPEELVYDDGADGRLRASSEREAERAALSTFALEHHVELASVALSTVRASPRGARLRARVHRLRRRARRPGSGN